MPNGGVNYKEGILFCFQGTSTQPSSLIYMEPKAPYKTTTILDNFYGRQFNSINDVFVHSDGSFGFTDPIYGFGRPNGISFSPDERIVYVTDTDCVHGN
jgi:gluconolactonase